MHSWKQWSLSLVLLAATPAWSKRPITHEDLWLMPRVGAAVVSPDGKQMVVPVTEPAYDPTKQSVDLWLGPVDASAKPRQLTRTLAAETTPVWSPDGKKLAFASQRGDDKVPQIYVLDIARGGEAERVSDAVSGARNPQFSPDSNSILFLSSVDTTAPEQAKAKGLSTARIYDEFPIRFWDKWLAPAQLRIFYRKLDGRTLEENPAKDLLADSALIRSPGFGGRNGEATDELDAIFSPDGASVVFVASQNRHLGARQFTHTDLYEVPVQGGEVRRLTGAGGTEASASYSRPRFSPDGQHLLALVESRSEKVYNAARLAVFSAPQWRAKNIIAAAENLAISSFDIASDNKTVYFLAESAGQERIWQVAISGAQAKRLSTSAQGLYSNLSSARKSSKPVLLASYESAISPSEVVRIAVAPGAAKGTHRALSEFSSKRIAELDMAAVEHFWHESDGRKVHNMLVKPAGFDPARKYPLFVLIHGGPHIMWRDQFFLRWNYHLLAGKDRVVLLTNYRGSTGFGESFAQAIQGDPLKGPADDLNSAADAALQRYTFIDATKQCAGGASYGGHLANWLQASTTRYRCLVSHAGLINLQTQWASSDVVYPREANMGSPAWEDAALWQEQNPIRMVPKFKTPVLVTFGELDYRVPINNGIEYWSMLKRQNVPSRLIVFPDENHWILKGENSRFFYQEVDAWLQRWLGS